MRVRPKTLRKPYVSVEIDHEASNGSHRAVAVAKPDIELICTCAAHMQHICNVSLKAK